MRRKTIKKYIFIFIIVVIAFPLVSCNWDPENKASAVSGQVSSIPVETTVMPSSGSETTGNKITSTESVDISNYEELLVQLNSYQNKYFVICKTGKLFDIDADDSYENKKSNLFAYVKSKISPDNTYFKHFNEIEIELSNDNYYKPNDAGQDYSNNPITVYSIQYGRYDDYLNKLYFDIKNKIPAEAFSELKKAEIQWVRDKENYLKTNVFQKGDETYPQAGEFKVDVTKFRCLMLILYLS